MMRRICIVLAALIAAGMATAPLAQAEPRDGVRRPLERLWSQYPVSTQHGQLSPPPSSTAEPPPAPAPPPPAGAPTPAPASTLGDDSGDQRWIWFGLAALLVLGAATAAVWFVAAPETRLRFRSRLPNVHARLVPAGAATTDIREEGVAMARFIRRGPESGDQDEVAQADEGRELASQPEASADEAPPVDRFLPYSLRAAPEDVAPTRAPAEGGVERRAYKEVGDRVAGVLGSAEQAAAEIREEATREAAGIRGEAREDALRIQRDAEETVRASEQLRSDAETYAAEVRTAADGYAQEKRREADSAVAEAQRRAGGEATEIVDRAATEARDVVAAARRRGAELEREHEAVQERLRELLVISRDVTGRLEQHLGDRDKLAADDESLRDGADDDVARSRSVVTREGEA